MADFFLASTGSNTAPYDTWAKAATSWATVVAALAAGSRLLVDSAYATSEATTTLTFPGTAALPNQVLSVTQSGASGIGALAAGAKCLTSGNGFTANGCFYSYGVIWENTNNSTTTISFAAATNNVQVHDTCKFRMTGTSATGKYRFGSSGFGSTLMRLLNCTFKYGASTQGWVPFGGTIEILGGSLEAGGSAPAAAFVSTAGAIGGPYLSCIGFDFSSYPSTFNVVSVWGAPTILVLSNLKLPASWSGSYFSGTRKQGCRIEAYNGDNAATGYRFTIDDAAALATESASIYLTGTVIDGAAISDKVVTTADVSYPAPFKSRWLYAYDPGGGAARAATVQAARDGSATKYNDDEVWLEVETLGTSGYPLGVVSSDAKADVITAAAAQATGVGTGSWTGLSGTACSMALAASYTPRNAGYVRARVCMAVPSATLYYDPKLTLG